MYNGCHNDIMLSIDYTNIQILHVVKHTAVVVTIYRYRSKGILYILATNPDCGMHRSIVLFR